MHPRYNSRTVSNDYCVLELTNAIDWSENENIRPACLPTRGPRSREIVC